MPNKTRRQFTKGMGVAGAFGIGATSVADAAKPEYDPGTEVQYVAFRKGVGNVNGRPIRKPIYETIEKNEWIRRHTATDVRDRLSNVFDNNPLVTVAFSKMKQSPTGFGVKVRTETQIGPAGDVINTGVAKSELEDIVPSSMVGHAKTDNVNAKLEVPITIKTVEKRKVCSPQAHDWDQIPGGIPIHAFGSSCTNGKGGGSNTAPFYTTSYGAGFITAGHVGGSTGNCIQQEYSSSLYEEIGTVKISKNSGYVDYAFVDMTSDETIANNPDIVKPDNSAREYPIVGIVTDSTLDNKAGTSFIVYTQGAATCRTSGTIIDTVGSGVKAVETTQDVDSGDSGGPLFHISNGEAYIAGNIIEEIGWNGANARSTTAETVEDDTGGVYIS